MLSCKFAGYFQNTFPQEHLWMTAFVCSDFMLLVSPEAVVRYSVKKMFLKISQNS